MTLAQILGILTLVVGVPLNLYVTHKLWRLSMSAPGIRVLRERALVATIVLATAVIFGLIFMNNDLPEPLLTGEATKLITRAVLLVLATVPAAYWLWLYRGR